MIPPLKIERAKVVITTDGRELHLLSCGVCQAEFYGEKDILSDQEGNIMLHKLVH
jgi:hypothetical protein